MAHGRRGLCARSCLARVPAFTARRAIFIPVRGASGFSLPLIAAALTGHFLFGTIVGADLPRLYRRFGAATITKAAGPVA